MPSFSLENLGRELRDALLRLLRDYSEALGLAILIAVILRLFVISALRISTTAMEPSLKLGDFIISYRLPYGISIPFTEAKWGQSQPRYGEVVLFKCPDNAEQYCLRRVVGLPGDKIELKKKRLILNDKISKYSLSDNKASASLQTKVAIASLRERIKAIPPYDIMISAQEVQGNFGPFIVPPGAFFALADNRDYSIDSRHWGAIPFQSIEAKALFVWLSIGWSTETEGVESKIRWDRIFQWVH